MRNIKTPWRLIKIIARVRHRLSPGYLPCCHEGVPEGGGLLVLVIPSVPSARYTSCLLTTGSAGLEGLSWDHRWIPHCRTSAEDSKLCFKLNDGGATVCRADTFSSEGQYGVKVTPPQRFIAPIYKIIEYINLQ